MKKLYVRSLMALALVMALTFSLASPALARETNILTGEALEVDLLTLKPGKPDTAAFEAAALALETALDKGAEASRVAELIAALDASYNQLVTDNVVFSYYYSCDVARYAADNLLWNKALQEVGNRFFQVAAQLAASPYRAEAEAVWGAKAVERLSTYRVPTPEMLALEARHGELVNEYWQFDGKTYTATYEGKEYQSFDEVYAAQERGELAYEQVILVLNELTRQANADRGPVFIEIVKTLNELARLRGYDNYGEYAYENNYNRDFTMEDVAVFRELVREYVVPVYQKSSVIWSSGPGLAASKAQCEAQFSQVGQATLVGLVRPYMDDVSGQLAERFDHMLQGNLLDIEARDTKVNQAYTSPLPSYQTSLIYIKPSGEVWDLTVLIHEFGHFAGSYGNTGLDKQMFFSPDVSEIDSQGLEMLYLSYAEEMLGEGASYYRAYEVVDMLNAIISGCYQDEFLQAAFTTPDLTLDKLNRMYRDITASYGGTSLDDTYNYSWTDFHHSFQQPFYYISYATSAMVALQLLERSTTDYDAACDDYLKAMEISKESLPFQALIARAGLDNIFEEETVARTASAVEDYFYEVACGVSFPDLAGTWAEDGARYCGAMGIVTGGPDGSFSDGVLTRAQAATMLWRSAGALEPADITRLQDVPATAWYAKAANRCAEKGILVDAEETTFSPDAPVSRQEFLLALYRVYGSPETSHRLSFSDQGGISPNALDAVRWAAESGLITGRPGKRLAPNDPISRAETAAILSRVLEG